MITPSVRATMAVHFPPSTTPIIISLPPQRAVSHCPPPALLTAPTCFPRLFFFFFGLKGGDFHVVLFCSALLFPLTLTCRLLRMLMARHFP